MQSSSVAITYGIEHVTLGSAYSDTAVVTPCSRRSQYM